MDNDYKNRDLLVDLGYEDVVVFDGSQCGYDYDGAIIGVTSDDRVVYSYDKMVEWLMLKEGLSMEDAIEWIDFNTIRSLGYVDHGPIIMYDLPR